MPDINIDVDSTEITRAIQFVFDHTRRMMPEIINRAALVTVIGGKGVQGAMQLTVKAAREQILAVPEKLVAGYVMNKHKGQKLTGDQVKALVRREYQRRVGAIGYTGLVGWSPAAVGFGGKGAKGHGTGKGFYRQGYGDPATPGKWEAEGVNATPAAVKIGAEPLDKALDNTAQDMIQYWEERTGAVFREADYA